MENPTMEILSKEGFEAVKFKNSGVAVLLYSLDENDILDKIGVVTEKNPFMDDNSYTGILMGTVEAKDNSLLTRSKIEALEESGYDIQEAKRWLYLGEMYTSKKCIKPIYCYAADVTGLTKTTPEGDGSKQEKGIKFELLSLDKAIAIPDALLQSCIFSLYLKTHKSEFNG